VYGGDEGVNDGIQILVGHSWQLDKPHPLVKSPFITDVVRAAVNGNFMAAFDEALAQLFDARLKATIARRNTSGAKECYSHVRVCVRYARADIVSSNASLIEGERATGSFVGLGSRTF